MPNGDGGGFGFGFDPSVFFSDLIATIIAVINAIINAIVALVQALVTVFNIIFGNEVALGEFSFSGLESVYKSIRNLWDKIFRVWVTAALRHLWDLYQKLTRWLRKLKAWLDRLHKIQQLQLVKALRRYLNLIHRIRKILLIFRILHIGIAKKLDQFLAGIEGRLIGRVFALIRKQNEVIRWLNIIIDPRTILHPGGQLAGLGRVLTDIRSALDALRPGAFSCAPAQQTGPGVAVRPWSSVSTQLLEESKNKSGDSDAIARQFAQMHGLFAQDIGNLQTPSAGGA